MRKYEPTEFGKQVKCRLIELNKTQAWLIRQLRAKTGKYMDSSLLNKILTGQINNPNWIKSINNLLDLNKQPPKPVETKNRSEGI